MSQRWPTSQIFGFRSSTEINLHISMKFRALLKPVPIAAPRLSSIFQRRPIAIRTRQFRRMDFNEWTSNVINKGTLRSSNHFSLIVPFFLLPFPFPSHSLLSLIIFISVLNTQSAYRPMPPRRGAMAPPARESSIDREQFLLFLFLSTPRQHF